MVKEGVCLYAHGNTAGPFSYGLVLSAMLEL